MQIKIIGAGLAGCEAALWLADHGVQVDLYEQKPQKCRLCGADLLQLPQGGTAGFGFRPAEN